MDKVIIAELVFKFLKVIYPSVRDDFVKAIDDPNTEIEEITLQLVDRLMGYGRD